MISTRSAGLRSAIHATVFRRGGQLSALHRPGSQRTQRREAQSPEPRKWPAGGPCQNESRAQRRRGRGPWDVTSVVCRDGGKVEEKAEPIT